MSTNRFLHFAQLYREGGFPLGNVFYIQIGIKIKIRFCLFIPEIRILRNVLFRIICNNNINIDTFTMIIHLNVIKQLNIVNKINR